MGLRICGEIGLEGRSSGWVCLELDSNPYHNCTKQRVSSQRPRNVNRNT